MKVDPPVITIDGPSGAGKSTLCKAMADKFQWKFLDSGAMYRVLAIAALKHHIDINFENTLIALVEYLDVYFAFTNGNVEVIFEGEDVSGKIRTQKIANISSRIAVFPRVRKALLRRQRSFCEPPGLIADGRDMGTVVFSSAPVKIFLDALPEERAYRRLLQLQKNRSNINYDRLLSQIKERDKRDRNRVIAPLIPARDALVLDTTNLTIEQVIEKALQYAHQKLIMQYPTLMDCEVG